jgi:hypothetical protein
MIEPELPDRSPTHGGVPSPPVAEQTVPGAAFQVSVTGPNTVVLCTLALRVVGTGALICATVAVDRAFVPLPQVSVNR